MKKVILLALLMPYAAFGQILENFESGSTINWIPGTEGRWKADTVASLSGKFSLHHIFDNPDAGADRIGISIKNLHPSQGSTRWSFLVRHGYDPSASNNWSVFLISDDAPTELSIDGGTNGFALGVNLTGYDDTLRLWKVKGNQITTIINCMINWQTDIGITNPVKILIERSKEGSWSVTISRLNGNVIGTSSGIDDELFSQTWFEVLYRYSSTRDRLLWLDDISVDGVFYEDNEPPLITRCEPTGKNSVKITLNEESSPLVIAADNFLLNSEDNKSYAVVKEKDLTYRVYFMKSFVNRSPNILIIKKICDVSGNCTQNINVTFTPSWAETGDIIISEIMSDPLPQVSLPGKEYIEILNRTDYLINLKDWSLSSEGQYSLFPTAIINPSGILIVCSIQDTAIFKKYGGVVGIKQFPSLTDGGRILCISDSTDTFIHGVEYSQEWFRDDLKSQGGWSLEMIDTGFPFYSQGNWRASDSRKGGTPGIINSVSESNPDNSFSGIINVFPEDSLKIHIILSEPLPGFQEYVKSIRISQCEIVNMYPMDPLFREFMIRPADPLKRNILYTLDITTPIFDFAGNQMQKCDFKFGLAETAEPGDILFNEILFNPWPGDPDYLELYNSSEKIIDVSRLQIVYVNDDTGEKSESVPVSDEEKCLLPGEYYAITTDINRLSERYFSADPVFIFQTASLPSIPDDKGHLILYNRELDIIDELYYKEEMHFALLSDNEGVSLEKTDPGLRSEEAGNWHSATESSGWGTPGAPNSVLVEMPETTDKVLLSSSKISPDSDGYEDFLIIKFNLTGNSNIVTLTVFDEAGNYVRKLASNLYTGRGTSISWDGTADDGSLVRRGIYIILITLHDDTGKTAMWKKVCTVIRK
jgi:hypothetical protein